MMKQNSLRVGTVVIVSLLLTSSLVGCGSKKKEQAKLPGLDEIQTSSISNSQESNVDHNDTFMRRANGDTKIDNAINQIERSDDIDYETIWQDPNSHMVEVEQSKDDTGAVVQIDADGNIIASGDEVDSEVIGAIKDDTINKEEVNRYFDYISYEDVPYDQEKLGVEIGLYLSNLGPNAQGFEQKLVNICSSNSLDYENLRTDGSIEYTDNYENIILHFRCSGKYLTIVSDYTYENIKYIIE